MVAASSTAAIATEGSSDKVRDWSLRRMCSCPKPEMPRSITLVATRRSENNSNIASARNLSPMRSRSAK